MTIVRITVNGREPEYVDTVWVTDAMTGRPMMQVPISEALNSGDTVTVTYDIHEEMDEAAPWVDDAVQWWDFPPSFPRHESDRREPS